MYCKLKTSIYRRNYGYYRRRIVNNRLSRQSIAFRHGFKGACGGRAPLLKNLKTICMICIIYYKTSNKGLGYCVKRNFQQYFSYIMAVSFIGRGNWSTRRKPPTCLKYSSLWAGFELTTLVVICTDCTGSCKSNYYAITTTDDMS